MGQFRDAFFEDTAIEARQGIFVEILAGNGNAGMAMIQTA